MTTIRFSKTTSRIVSFVALTAAVCLSASNAFAVSARVKAACIGDYLSYCSAHSPDSPGVRKCMNANGHKLSARCVNALVSAGEVSKTEVARRAASLR